AAARLPWHRRAASGRHRQPLHGWAIAPTHRRSEGHQPGDGDARLLQGGGGLSPPRELSWQANPHCAATRRGSGLSADREARMNGGPSLEDGLHHVPTLTRRAMLWRLGTAALLLAMWPADARMASEDVQQAIRQLIGERQPQPGGITLTLPKIAETGNSVPLT